MGRSEICRQCPNFGFQSFFWWKSRNGKKKVPARPSDVDGFNPSFDGNPEMGTLQTLAVSSGRLFQSFFWWKSRNGKAWLGQHLWETWVSILLLMEIPKWASLILGVDANNFSFNHSFDGNPEMGCYRHPDQCRRSFVSILLLMEIPKWAKE